MHVLHITFANYDMHVLGQNIAHETLMMPIKRNAGARVYSTHLINLCVRSDTGDPPEHLPERVGPGNGFGSCCALGRCVRTMISSSVVVAVVVLLRLRQDNRVSSYESTRQLQLCEFVCECVCVCVSARVCRLRLSEPNKN